MQEIKKIKVAQIVGKTTLGGVCNSVLNYYKNIDREKFDFDFYTYGESRYDEQIRALGGNVYHIPNFINFPRAMLSLRKHLKTKKYDIVHSHLTSLSVFPLTIAKSSKVGVRICHAHSTSYKFDYKTPIKKVFRFLTMRKCTNFLACGKKTAEWMYKSRAGEATIIPNAIDFSKFYKDENLGIKFRKENKIGKNDKVIGFAGRFVYQKNLFFLLKAFKELTEKKGNFKLLLLGDGESRNRLIRKIEKYGIKDKVIIIKPVSAEKMNEAYNAMDLFCLTSRFEGLPLTAIESAACGVRGIYSNKITDEIKILENNMLLPTKKPKKWANIMYNMLKSNKKTVEIINAERVILKQGGYDIGTATKILENYYLKCLETI